MRVSFDFDGTLDKQVVKNYAKELIGKGVEVWIVTSRYDSIDKYNPVGWRTISLPKAWNELFKVAEELGIPKDRIHFTNKELKQFFFENNTFTWHLDDDTMEMFEINNATDTKCIYVKDSDFIEQCNRLLYD